MAPYPILVLHQEQWAWHQAQGLLPVHYLNLAARAPTARIDDAESTALRMGTASTPGVERSDAHSPAAMVVRPALSTTSPTTSEARMDEGAMTIASLTAKDASLSDEDDADETKRKRELERKSAMREHIRASAEKVRGAS